MLFMFLFQFVSANNNKKVQLMKSSNLIILLLSLYSAPLFSGPPIPEEELALIRTKRRKQVEENRIKAATTMHSYEEIIGDSMVTDFLSTANYIDNDEWSFPHQEIEKINKFPLHIQECLIKRIEHKKTLLHIDDEDRNENYKLNALQRLIQQK